MVISPPSAVNAFSNCAATPWPKALLGTITAAFFQPLSTTSCAAKPEETLSRPIRLNEPSPSWRIRPEDEPMLRWTRFSCTRYWPTGMVMPDEYSPITAGTLSTVTSFLAASSAEGARPPESSTMTLSLPPRTPPLALTSSTASSMPRRWSSPMVALAPESGRTAPMVTSAACAMTDVAASIAAVTMSFRTWDLPLLRTAVFAALFPLARLCRHI